MKRFRLLQVCNRLSRAHLWVCPWLRDGWEIEAVFQEFVVKLNQPMTLKDGVEYFVDIDFVVMDGYDQLTKSVFITPSGDFQWFKIPTNFIVAIVEPDQDDFGNIITYRSPRLPWVKSLQG